MVEIEETAASTPKFDLALSKSLREVTNEENDRRIKASVKVLQGVRSENAKTTLTRLIRGTGATMTNSKIGFFTLLSGFLKENADSVTYTDIFEIMDQELKITNKAKTRETADAYVGRVLTITAMIRQQMLLSASMEDLSRCTQIIVETTKLKAYHSKLAYNALISLVQSDISERQVQKGLLPTIRNNLKLTWTDQTMSSLHFMMELKTKFPKLVPDKFLKESFSVAEILATDTFEHVYRIFWQEQNESSIMQPSYDALAKYAANSPNLVKFAKYLAHKLQTAHSRNKEVITVKVVTEMINNLPSPQLVTKMLSTDFWTVVFQSVKRVKPTDEILRAVYLEFFEAIFNVIAKADAELQFTMLNTLLLRPGTISVDKYAVTNRIVSRSINLLHEPVLCKLILLLQNIVTEEDGQTWLYAEKVTALGYLQKILHNKKVNVEQKQKALVWLATHGLFESESESTVTAELADQLKRLFYKTLESPFIRIKEERALMVELMAFVERHKKEATMRQPLEKANAKMWTEVLREMQKREPSDNLVMFHVLLSHMALQLFNDAELAANAIKELRSCMERATATSLRRKTKSADGEPEWTEVMVDLILHLLSQNSVILRNVVKKVFPNICSQLNLSAVHQMLSLLDMNEENPLSDQSNAENGEDEVDEEEEEDDEEMDSEDGKSDSEDDDEEVDEVGEEEDDEHDATVSDHLRNAISVALMANHDEKDDDKDSIDLDTMTEEEGQRLDEALANAFKLMGNRRGNGKTKSEKMEKTALLHFRNRVLDLLIIYLKSNPELVVVVEILSVLYRMLDQYSDDDAAEIALFKKVQNCIDVALASKVPSEVTTLSRADTVNYVRTFITKCANPKGIEERSVALQKIIRFFTQIDNHLPQTATAKKQKKTEETLSEVLGEELKSFLTQRTPVMGLNIFTHILQSTWNGIWHQLDVILAHGLTEENRVFKRVQSLDLLRTFQKNVRFIKEAAEQQALVEYLTKLHSLLQSYGGDKMTPKEFKSYVSLLLDIRLFHNKNAVQKCHLKWTDLEANVQSLRKSVKLDTQTQTAYSQLCKLTGWEIVKENAKDRPAENGHNGDAINGEDEVEDGDKESSKKRKTTNENAKEKKLKKQKRFESSNGLDETIHFTNMS